MFRCQRQSCWEARRAPSAIDVNLAHAISGSTWSVERPKVAKPQSGPAITPPRPRGRGEEPLGGQLGVLDEIGRGVEHAGYEDLLLGEAHLPEHDPFVL